MNLKYGFVSITFCFYCLFFIQTVKAQQFSLELKKAVPQAETRLDSEDIQQRISVLDKLVIFKRDDDVIDTILPFNLPADDYALVVGKIFEKDLARLETQNASQTLSKTEFLMVKFRFKEFAKNLVEYIPKFAPNATDFPRIGIQYGILGTVRTLKAKEFAPQIAAMLLPSVRSLNDEALSVLIEFRAKEAVPALLTRLYDKNAYVRGFALQNLAKVGGKQIAPPIARLLKDEDLNNRYWALDALAKFDANQNYVPEIRQMLADSQTVESKIYAIAALVDANDKQAIPLAMEFITDKDEYVRGEMLRRLVDLKAEPIVPSLLGILQNKTVFGGDIGTNSNIRSAVIGTLRDLKVRELIPILRGYLRERSYSYKNIAAQSLGELDAGEAVDDLLSVFYKDLPNPPDRISNATYDSAEAAVALAKIGHKKAWKDLIDAAANPKYPYRSQIIIELNKHLDFDLWQTAQKTTISPNQNRNIVSIKELTEIYTRESGIPVILHFEPGKDTAKRLPLAPPYKDTKGYPWAYVPSDVTLLDGLREFPRIISEGTLPQNFTFIFDDKQIHILTVEKAVEWWRKNLLKEN